MLNEQEMCEHLRGVCVCVCVCMYLPDFKKITQKPLKTLTKITWPKLN